MGTVYKYLWAIIGNWWWLLTAILFVIDKFLEWVWTGYRDWLNETFSKETRRKFFWRTLFAFVFLSGFLAWRDEHEKMANLQKQISDEGAARGGTLKGHALVSVTKEGALSVSYNLSAYGLSVRKIEFEGNPAYTLIFEKEPEYFRVSPMEAATVEVVKVGLNVYRVKFIGVEFESPIESEFSVMMSPLSN